MLSDACFEFFSQMLDMIRPTHAIDVYGHYQGLPGATRRSWARDNSSKLEAYIHGHLAGLDWLYDVRNKEQAITILHRHLPQISPELATQSYVMSVNPKGFTPNAELDLEGVRKFVTDRLPRPKSTLHHCATTNPGIAF
jgi:hypothetical protein